jgi:hypothetical protein
MFIKIFQKMGQGLIPKRGVRYLIAAIIFIFSLPVHSLAAALWQWSVPAPTIPDRRAFLWVPPDCKQVRGLVIACQNMLEKPLFERPAFRKACAENDLGIVMIFPGHDWTPDDKTNLFHPKRSYLDIFLNPNFQWGKSTEAEENPVLAGEDLQKVLDALAEESGYSEIRYAPLMPVGHSSASSFVWHLYRWDADRIFAMMPFKTPAQDDGPQGIPIFDINSEWFDYGVVAKNCSSNPNDLAAVLRARANGRNSLFGYYIDIGSGHCDASDDAIQIMSLFLQKVVAARIPKDAPKNAPVILKPVKLESGWLLDPTTLGKPGAKPVAYADWRGDPQKAFWYLDKEMAGAVQNHMANQLAKQPQFIGFILDGVTNTDGGMFNFRPTFLDDTGTFKLEATYIEHLTHSDLHSPGTTFGHSDSPILYRVNSGALVQTGSNTFRICPHAGPLVPQGNPWEPTIVAYNLGDKNFRPTGHPAHVYVSIMNADGQPQTIDFAKIPDQKSGTESVKLQATASSGLPVQFFMVSGPATIAGDTLRLEKIPVRARFPVRILVSAFQWGRSDEPKVQSAGPVMQEFFIQK